jgi:hypothetical protein
MQAHNMGICLQGLKKTMEILNQDSPSPERDWKPWLLD